MTEKKHKLYSKYTQPLYKVLLFAYGMLILLEFSSKREPFCDCDSAKQCTVRKKVTKKNYNSFLETDKEILSIEQTLFSNVANIYNFKKKATREAYFENIKNFSLFGSCLVLWRNENYFFGGSQGKVNLNFRKIIVNLISLRSYIN